MDQEELTTAVFGYLSNFHATIVDLGTATVLVQTLVAVAALPQHEDLTNSLSKCIGYLLGIQTMGRKPQLHICVIFCLIS